MKFCISTEYFSNYIKKLNGYTSRLRDGKEAIYFMAFHTVRYFYLEHTLIALCTDKKMVLTVPASGGSWENQTK